MSSAYRIIKWDENHSNHEQKRSGGKWIRCGTSFDSLGLRKLLSETRGLEYFGAYILLSELAAKMPTPGVLANEQGPLDADSIALVTGATTKRLDAALTRLQKPDLGWIDKIDYVGLSGTDPPNQRSDSDSSHVRAQAAANLPTNPPGGAGGIVSVLSRMTGQKSHAKSIATSLAREADAIAYWWDIKQDTNAKTVLGCMKHRVDAGEKPPRMKADALVAAIREGIVESVNGIAVKQSDVLSVISKGLSRVCGDRRIEILIPTEQLQEVRLG